MSVTSHQGDYQRVCKSITSLSKPHYGLSPLAMSKITHRLIRLRGFKRAIERTCSTKSVPYVPAPLAWKAPKQKEQEHRLGLIARILAWLRKIFQGEKRG